jgi:cytochrome P450
MSDHSDDAVSAVALTPAEPDPPFDYRDEFIRAHEEDYFRTQRERCPVLRSEEFGGFWALTKFDDIAAAAHDHEHFTTTGGPTIPSFGRPYGAKPLTSDPPEHAKYRKILQPFFTAAAVAAMEPLVRTIVRERVADIRDRGAADFMTELGEPVPAEVMAVTLGVGRERAVEISLMNKKTQSSAINADAAGTAEVQARILEFITAEIESRRREPRDDLLSAIVHSEVDGEPITDDIRYGMAMMLIVAGTDTTVSGITNTLALLAHRSVGYRGSLLAEPDLLSGFVNESLRYDAPVFGLARTVREPVRMRGVAMRPGDRVLLLWGSGNRDADRWADADTFDPDRKETGNLTFGWGRHRCIGDHLAKLEIRVVVEEVLRTMPGYRLADAGPLPMRTDLEHGPRSLPVVW